MTFSTKVLYIQGAPKNFTPLCHGKSRLHFVEEKAKVNAAYYVGSLLPMLVDDCKRLLPFGFVLQQDGAPAHTARQTQGWLRANCTDFIAKDQWPPNSPDLNPLDHLVWGAMLQAFHWFTKCQLFLFYTCCLSSVSKTRDGHVKCKNSVGGRA